MLLLKRFSLVDFSPDIHVFLPVHIEKKTPTIMLLLSKPGHIILYACCCHFLILEFRDYGEETTRY
jgi:hypothetical protein